MNQTPPLSLLSILVTTMTVVTHPYAQRRDRPASGTHRQTLASTAGHQTSYVVLPHWLPHEGSLG
jgi:hypothetical protein